MIMRLDLYGFETAESVECGAGYFERLGPYGQFVIHR